LAVPVDLTDTGLSASTVDRAREAAKDRYRKPSAAGRYWQLRGIVCCSECGSILSPHTVTRKRADGATARNHYHQCRRHFNTDPRVCDHTISYPAAAPEEAIWQAIHGLISDSERLRRQWEAEVERKRQELLRRDPDREARHLAEQLRRLEHRRSGYYDLAADGDMSREDLRLKLREVDMQRHELQKTLRDAQGRRRSIAEAKRQWKLNEGLLQLVRIHYVCAGPEDRRRIYRALRLRADVDRDGAIRLAGIFDPDVYLPTLVQGPPLDPSELLPAGVERHRVVVASGNNDWKA
jgi:Recombinase zinc beta ribbon domain